MNKKFFLNCISLAALGSIFITSNVSARQSQCNEGTLTGSYAMSFQGTRIKDVEGVPFAWPVTMVGLSTYDGKGNVNSTMKLNQNGTLLELDNVIGTYTVEPDCTGTAQLVNTVGHQPPVELTVWAVSTGIKQGDFIFTSTTPDIVGNGTGIKQ